MPKRVCDSCGKEKNVSGGKTCQKGHFMCSSCVHTGGIFFDSFRKQCPVCGKSLR